MNGSSLRCAERLQRVLDDRGLSWQGLRRHLGTSTLYAALLSPAPVDRQRALLQLSYAIGCSLVELGIVSQSFGPALGESALGSGASVAWNGGARL